ncbi:MAG: hypothetical protein HN531_00840 [Opitutae bacterium]|nr:hypothetical protein [Opitutae bacterium]
MKTIYLRRTLFNRCPRCGEGHVLKNLFNRHDNCSSCELTYSREDGFFIGGIPISYGLICGLWIVPLLIAWMLEWLPKDWFLGLCFGGVFVFPILSYHYCQCLWLGLYFVFAEHEMPERGKDSV